MCRQIRQFQRWSVTYDEGVANHFKNLLFVLDVVDVLALDDIILLHGLECEPLGLVLLEACQLDISKRT